MMFSYFDEINFITFRNKFTEAEGGKMDARHLGNDFSFRGKPGEISDDLIMNQSQKIRRDVT